MYVTTWMDVEGVMLQEVRKTKTTGSHLYVESKKTEQKQIQRTSGWLQGERRGV